MPPTGRIELSRAELARAHTGLISGARRLS
jgi:hypothetical protein